MLERYGLTPAQAVKLFFTQIANTNEVPLSFDYDKHVFSESTRKILHQNSAEIATGDCDLYETPEQAMAAMLEMAKP